MKRVLKPLAAAAAALVFVAVVFRRRRGRRQRVDIYFSDGSMVSLPEDAPEARRLLPFAHELLATARP